MRLVFMRLVHGACVAIASQRKGDKSSIMKLVHGWKHTVANLECFFCYIIRICSVCSLESSYSQGSRPVGGAEVKGV